MNNFRSFTFSQVNKSSFLRFLLVGGSATFIHYLIMAFLMYFLNISAGASSASGYAISTLYNYWANSRYSFGGGHSHGRSLPRFLLVAMVGLAINQVVLMAGIYFSLPVIVSQFSATTLVVFWNYFFNAVWTFAKGDSKL